MTIYHKHFLFIWDIFFFSFITHDVIFDGITQLFYTEVTHAYNERIVLDTFSAFYN